ncbi:hypothetical protein ACSBR2_028245 [Camellia fascicularis]
MSSFLKGKKLWCLVIGDTVKPIKNTDELASQYEERLDDWDNKNLRSSHGAVILPLSQLIFNLGVLTQQRKFGICNLLLLTNINFLANFITCIKSPVNLSMFFCLRYMLFGINCLCLNLNGIARQMLVNSPHIEMNNA